MSDPIMKSGRIHPDSILDLAAGAVPERVQEAFKKVMDNILDPNTKATAKRSITVTYTFAPDEDRTDIRIGIEVKEKTAPLKSVSTGLYMIADPNGIPMALEQLPLPAGQMTFDGNEVPQPMRFKLDK